MEFRNQVLASQKINEEILKSSDVEILDIIDKLHTFVSFQEDLFLPLSLFTNSEPIFFNQTMHSILNKLIVIVKNEIEKNKEISNKILHFISPYIHQKALSGLFQYICESMDVIPDEFLFELLDLETNEFKEIFTSSNSRKKIFIQCKPLFNNSVLAIINEFCENPMNLDSLLNLIRRNIEQRRHVCGITLKKISNLFLKQKLSEFHHELFKKVVRELSDVICDYDMFYQETCCILRDLWERTMNPLYCALRLELAYRFKNNGNINDKIRPFMDSVFSFLDSNKLTFKNSSEREITPDLIFVSYDPLLRFYLSCAFISKIFERIEKQRYEPYENRTEQNVYLTLLTLTMKDEEREDLSNYLESAFIAAEINENKFNENLEDMKKLANSNDEAAKLILFTGELYMEFCNSPVIIQSALNSNVLSPDIITGYLMARWISLLGLNDNSVTIGIELLIKWSSNRNVLLYFLALLKKRVSTEPEIVKEILPKISSFCVGKVEQLIYSNILSIVNQ